MRFVSVIMMEKYTLTIKNAEQLDTRALPQHNHMLVFYTDFLSTNEL